MNKDRTFPECKLELGGSILDVLELDVYIDIPQRNHQPLQLFNAFLQSSKSRTHDSSEIR